MTRHPSRLDALADADGRADRRVSVRAWEARPVDLVSGDDGPLLCERADKPLRRVSYRPGMFERFVQLADKDDAAIVAFANQFGGLMICRHGMPLQLADSCSQLRATAGRFRGFMAERPEHWRAWARRFAAAVNVARQLSGGEPPREDDVSTLTRGLQHHPYAAETATALRGQLDVPPGRDLVTLQLWWFARLFNSWLFTQVAMTDTPGAARRLRLEHGSSGLFPTLALQAALAATGSRAFVVCSNCGCGFEATRQPSKGDRAYCPSDECRVKAKNRDAAADKRFRDQQRRVTSQRRRRR